MPTSFCRRATVKRLLTNIRIKTKKMCRYVATQLTSYGWELGPQSEMAEKCLAKWPAAIFGEGPKWQKKWPGKWPDRQKMAKFQLFGHFSAILGVSPKNGRRPFRQPFFGHCQFRAHFPPVAGQRDRNRCVACG